ncbi:oplophorus-luciferin 2-monooxygenase non-catalytic subunit-like [Homarus americanus]|uniref:oplophorus-luciferin 2-monooxygenase non-catalytic subunit-like n=1 Tax=Homarus americanus TaxID=6706 RepID=UPI001C462D41|nr:oplophorus-luciferin 2-monooxygenase non-catalytic subunit-like [Homarus americanus]
MALFHTLFCILLVVLCCVSLNGGDAVGAVSDAAADVGEAIRVNATGRHDDDKAGGDVETNLPCPEAESISPCLCTSDGSYTMYMDCSAVESEKQLASIMSQKFPFPGFYSLVIKNNDNLKVLRSGALGVNTFQEFHITDGALQEVEVGALSGSYSTTTILDFNNNYITSFPWERISSFISLETLSARSNFIALFPTLVSNSLAYLDLSNNPMGSMPVTAFINTPALKEIYIREIGIYNLPSGTFFGHPHLSTLQLSFNNLGQLTEGAVQMGAGKTKVYLNNNMISNVAANSFSGLISGDFVYLYSNELTELVEEVWQPLIMFGVYLDFRFNPLTCGCDIAWIVLNPSILSHIDSDTTCSNGQFIVDLDPAIYEKEC